MGFAPADIFGISGMNKIYKLKFDKRRNELVVVSEITAGLGKSESTGHISGILALPFRKLLGTLSPLSLMTGLAMGVLPMMALANPNLPTGGQIVGGQGSISVAGNQMTIHQGSQNMAANWNSFDIGKNNTVQFVQPNSSAVALNRVTGGHESQIMGSLNANGKVFLINPNGVLFGKGASVNTAGLVASTKNINTADFMKGNYTFSGGSAPGAEIINQGTLTTTKNGFIVLAANRVKNTGHIITPSGKAVLAAADTVALQLDNSGLTSVVVNGSVVNALVDNRGLISATNGQVYLTARGKDMLLNTVVNNGGTIEAKGLSANGGIIRLDGGDSGVVNQSGQLLADSETGKGGRITLEGQNIHLAGKSQTSATGKNGGEIYVGGGWQGKDSHIKNASKVVMDKSATIDVSATQHGDGGKAVLWSDDYTNFQGTILAKGGRQSGNGGEVETSSHNNLQAFGQVDASSARGKGGQWLLDPADVTIVGTGSESGISSSTTDNNDVFSPTASGAQILNTSIVNQLNTGTNVTVQTSGTDVDGQTGNITVNANIVKTAGSDATLTLKADNKISTANSVSIGSSLGKLNLNLLAANSTNNATITLGNNINISLNGGDFYAGPATTGNNASLIFNNNGKIIANNITMDVSRGLSGYAFSLFADNNLTINGPVSSNTGWGVTTNFSAGNLLSITANQGGISFTATDATYGGSWVVISGKNGVDMQTSNGAVSVQSSASKLTGASIISDAGNVSIGSGAGLTLLYTNITSGADINLRAAGSNTGMLKVQSSNLITTSGGNITLKQKNHRVLAQDGTTNTNANAMVVDILSSSLNSGDGDISVEGYNPNVCLSSASYTNTIRNGGIMVGVRNNSVLTGNNISLNMELNGSNAAYIPVFINGANITAKNDISISSTVNDSANPVQIEIRGAGNTLTAQAGNISLTNRIKNSSTAILLNGSGSNNAITLNALNGSINLNGTSTIGTGVGVTNATLNAQRANIYGLSTDNSSIGNGFSITNTTLGGELTDLINVTLNSSGSGMGVTNVLDNSIVNDSNRNTLLSKDIDNMTVVDMNGTSIFDDGTKAWEQKYQTDAHPNSGWIFNHTTVNATNVDLSGVGFTNSSLNITAGDLIINNNGSVLLTNSIINALQGAVKVNAQGGGLTLGAGSITAKGDINLQANNAMLMQGANLTSSSGGVTANTTLGNLDLTSGNISANKDINLHTENGTLTLKGKSGTSTSNITSIAGNVNITANVSTEYNTGVKFDNVNVSALAGEIYVRGENSADAIQTRYVGDIFGGVYFLNSVSFSALKTTIDAISSYHPTSDSSSRRLTPVTALSFAGYNPVTLNISGDAVINALAQAGAGVVFNAAGGKETDTHINMRDGSLIWTASTGDAILTRIINTGAFSFENAYYNNQVFFNLDNARVTLHADASGAIRDTVPGFASSTPEDALWIANGFIFSGNGSVDVVGKSNMGDGINARFISNKDLNGSFSLTGESDSGVGVNLDRNLSVNLVNASINGSSNTGIGVNISALAGVKQVNLGNNEITGTSNTSSGIQVTGSNVSITNGSLNGTSVGSGVGINLTGGKNYNFSGVNVSGHSKDGSGVSVSGNLSVNDQTSINGTSSGSGDGVVVTGNLQSVGGVTINGTSTDGNGVAVSGNASLTNATVSGNSTSGSGVSIAGQLTADGNTALNGTSVSGSGMQLSDTSVTNASLSGNSMSGSGVVVSGGVSLDEHSAQNLNATSDSGDGLRLTNANITVVDDNGVAVTSPVELTGQSSTGSGITVTGNTTLNTVILNGTTSSGEGSGLTVSGNLTIGDALSGLTGSTSGNGTGVVIDNATINSDSYTQAGKDFIINASSNGNGTAIKAQGDNQLTNVTLNGSASGNGSAVEVSGNVTGGVIKGDSSTVNGTAVNIVGNTILSGTNVSGNAGAGTGVNISGDANLNNATIDGQTQTGKGVDVSGNLTGAGSTTVIGQANGSGIGASLSGGLDGVQLNGTSAEGTGAQVSDGASITGGSVAGTSTNGTGTVVSGNVSNTGNITGSSTNGNGANVSGHLSGTGSVSGQTQGTGNGITVSGQVDGGQLSGTSAEGTGAHLDDNTTLTNATVNGSTESGKGVDITGNLTNAGNSTVAGNASGNGAGVDLGGNVTGGSISGGSANGTGVIVSGNNSTVTNTTVTGNTTSGTGVNITGNLTNAGNSTVAGNASGNGTGTEISGALNGTVSGSSTAGTGAHVSDGAHISAGSSVAGSSDTGSGTVVEGSISNNGQISGTSNKGDGLNLNATVSGGGKLMGNSVDGTGVHVSGNSAMNGGSLSGSTTNGSGLHLDGDLKHTPDSTINSSVTIGGHGQESSGQGSIVEVKPENPVDKQTEKMMSVISRQQAITAQKLRRGTVLQTSGYRPSDEPVEIEVCVDGECQSTNVHHQLSSASEGKDRMSEKDAKRK